MSKKKQKIEPETLQGAEPASETAPEPASEPSPALLADSVETSALAPHLSSALSGLIAEYARLGAEIDAYLALPYLVERQETYSDLKTQIEEICLTISSKRILSTDGIWSTTRTAKTTTKLNQTKLMVESVKRGYDPVEVKAIIDLSTEKTKGKEYVLVNIGKDGKGK